MKNPCLIAFDLDDTLYHERDFLASGHRMLAGVLASESGTDKDILYSIISAAHPRGIEAAMAYLAVLGRPTKYTIDELVKLYRTHKPDISLDPATERVLQHLKDQGHVLAIISDGSSATQRDKISTLGLYRYVEPEAVFISEETGGDKNTPISFAHAETIAPKGATRIYVGDNPAKDFLQPNIRGWVSVMLAATPRNVFPQRIDAFPSIFRPRIVIDSLDRLIY